MLRKYTLIASVLTVLGVPLNAQAQTMDIAMKIQSILDQFSEIRSGMKQIQSGKNIESMLQNLKGSGDWKEKLKNSAGTIFDAKAEKGGVKQSLLLLPDGLADKVERPEDATDWVKKNMYMHKENPSFEEIDALQKKRQEFKFTAMTSGFGKAIALRKQFDQNLESIEKLRQDAESKDAETDLQNEVNKLALLKLEQTNFDQLLSVSEAQIKGAFAIDPADRKISDIMSGDVKEQAEEKVKELTSELDKIKGDIMSKADQIKGFAEDAADKVNQFKEDAMTKVDELKSAAKDAVDQAKDAAQDAVNQAKDAAQDAMNQAKDAAQDAMNQAKDAAQDAVKQAKDAAQDAVNQAKDAAQDAANQAKSAAQDAANQAKGAAQGAVNGGAASGATSAASNAMNDAKSAFRGF